MNPPGPPGDRPGGAGVASPADDPLRAPRHHLRQAASHIDAVEAAGPPVGPEEARLADYRLGLARAHTDLAAVLARLNRDAFDVDEARRASSRRLVR